jgi:uracil-DNA glycosylase family 4
MQDTKDVWSKEGKSKKLKDLYSEWKDCKKCRLSETRTNIVFGNGIAHAEIMLIGEGPGEHEDNRGDVFIGESGHLLSVLLKEAKIDREELFITNLVMCKPPQNRKPMRDECLACWGRLYQQIYVVDPLLIIPVGAEAMQALMGGEYRSIQKFHGKFGHIKIPGQVEDELRYSAMPIVHPSFILREDNINRTTKNWEHGGWAHKTFKDLVKARQRIEKLKDMYRPVQLGMPKQTEARRGLRVVK